jgi:hypothetical protein
MSATDLIMKSIENLILYGIEVNILEEDSNEYLLQMENYYNDNSDDMLATLDIDTLLIDTAVGDTICNIFIKDGILRIVPTANESAFAAIVLMLEFISEKAYLFEKQEEINNLEESEEDSGDDFEWI